MAAQVSLPWPSWRPAARSRCRGSSRSVARVLAAAGPDPPAAAAGGSASGAAGGNGSSASNGVVVRDVGRSTNICWHEAMVSRSDKEQLLGQRGCVLWFTGLSASGKSTVACTLEHLLHESGHFTVLLDGDNVRHGLNKDLGFSAEDRTENIRRIGEVAKLFADSGVVCLTSFISPYRADRDAVRARCRPGEFLEVWMDVPLEVCEARDPKGLYAKARAGLIKNFTGIDDPYEAPAAPEFQVACYTEGGQQRTPREMAQEIYRQLEGMGYLRDPAIPTLAAAVALQRKHSDGILDFASL